MTEVIDTYPQVYSQLNSIDHVPVQSYPWKLVVRIFAPLLLFISAVVSSGTCLAIDDIVFSLGRLSTEEWSIENAQIRLELGTEAEKSDRFSILLGKITHPLLEDPIEKIEIHCLNGTLTNDAVSCAESTATLIHPFIKSSEIKLKLNWNNKEQLIELTANNIQTQSGKIDLKFIQKQDDWLAESTLGAMQIETMFAMIPQMNELRQTWNLAGRINGKVSVEGVGADIKASTWAISFADLQFAGPDSAYFGEALSGDWKGSLNSIGGSWKGQQSVAIKQGATLTPWAYIGAEQSPIEVMAQFTADQSFSEKIAIENFHYTHADTLSIEGNALLETVDGSLGISNLSLSTESKNIASLHSGYFSPILSGTAWESLTMTGAIQSHFEMKNGQPLKTDLIMDDLSIQLSERNGTQENLFSLKGIVGNLAWRNTSQGESSQTSQIRWREGLLYQGISLGPSDIKLSLDGYRIALQSETAIPILDGHLQAEAFAANFENESPEVMFKGYLTPISMEKLTESLGLPTLSGQLSGMIPSISLHAGALKVGGIALVKVFNGDVRIKNLQLDELFGVLPVFKADIELDELDLETLTETFAFGKITGKLDGRVDQLRLENWQPVAFDAWFRTPEDDQSRHRISQKAVDNISNLGGAGISGAVSRSFLRVFEEFGYSKLGISCQLQNGRCLMGGIEDTPKGYYLVKGGGIPRIDIMGFNRETDWDLLIEKLKQITEGEGPTIQ